MYLLSFSKGANYPHRLLLVTGTLYSILTPCRLTDATTGAEMRDTMKSKNVRGEGDEEEGDEEEGEGGKRPAATVAADSSALALVRIVLDCIMSGCIVFVILSFCHLRQIGAVCVSGGFVCIPSETMPGSSASNRV